MYYPVTLVLKSYKPLNLRRGMLFVNNETDLIELSEIPFDENTYIENFGYPTEPFIIDPVNGNILAQPHQIAWIDEGDYYRDIRTDDIQKIVNNQVSCWLLIEDEGLEVVAIIDENKVILLLEGDES